MEPTINNTNVQQAGEQVAQIKKSKKKNKNKNKQNQSNQQQDQGHHAHDQTHQHQHQHQHGEGCSHDHAEEGHHIPSREDSVFAKLKKMTNPQEYITEFKEFGSFQELVDKEMNAINDIIKNVTLDSYQDIPNEPQEGK